jgi:hypothetical protein
LIFIKFASETWEGTWGTIQFVPIPKETIEATLRIFRFLWMIEQTHVKAADVVHIVLDVVRRAACRAFAFVNFVGSICAHVAIDVQLVIAYCAPAIT